MDLTHSFDLHLLASTFGVIFVAELPDKTALATVMLGSGRRPIATFLGVALAFFLQTVVAILFGRVIGLLPHGLVEIGAGVMFLVFAVLMLRRPVEQPESAAQPSSSQAFRAAATKAFLVIFVAEWGDLTQLATAALAAKHPEAIATVFVAAMSALWVVTAIAITIGHQLQRRIDVRTLQRAAAAAFGVIGLLILMRAGSKAW